MVGRERELARLDDALDNAIRGRGRTVVIGGEAGIGKTRLVATVADAARSRSGIVLAGACLPASSGAVPYSAFVEWLRALTRSVEPGRLAPLLGPGRAEIGRLLPELAGSDRSPADRDADRTGPGRLFEAVLAVVERLARRSLIVLVVEDVQWADPGSQGLLTFLSRNLRDASVVIVMTVRTDELEGGSRSMRWLAELDRDAWVDRIELEPLTRQQIIAMVRAISDTRVNGEALGAIIRRSGGNPFFVEQLTAASVDGGSRLPPRLRDVLVARLAELPPATRDVLRGAAAAGRRVDDAVLAAVLDMPPDAIAAALRPALESEILVAVDDQEDGAGGYAFRHALLAEVAYATLLVGERARLHAAFASELERRREIGGVPVTAAELAFHWVAAREEGRAIPALMAAGESAERVYAFGEALRHYETALEMWDRTGVTPVGVDRVGLLQRAAECAVLSGAYGRAVELGKDAIVTAELGDMTGARQDPARIGALHDRLRWFLWESGDRLAAEAATDQALRLTPASPPSATRARVVGQAAGVRLFSRDPVGAADLARDAVEAARAAHAPSEEAFALGILGWAEAVTGDVDAGITTYRQALSLAERLGGVEGIALGHTNLAALLDQVGRSEESLAAAIEGFGIAERLGVARTYGGGLLGDAAKALFDLGRWDEAAAMTDQGLDLDPVGPAAVWLHINRARVDTNRGDLDAAEAHVDQASELIGPAGDARYRVSLMAAVVELAAARGRLPVVRAVLDQALEAIGSGEPGDPALSGLMWLGLRAEADASVAARTRGDVTKVAAIGERVTTIASRAAAAGTSGFAGLAYLAAIFELCALEIDRARALAIDDRWAVNASTWESLGRPHLAAYGHYRTAEAILGRRGDRSEAATALRSAHAIATRLGATPLRLDIEQLARQARIEVRQESGGPETEGPDPLGLTDREAEVIRLVAAGRSNQQIADELFITRKTASVHVSNILGKLGVANRVEAAAIAHRLGLGPDGPGD
jgi:DNA-binding CsgD family transcriptional regulator/tetratricopeptide (TPR) repeat protein